MPRRLSVGSILAVLIFAGSMGIAAQELATLNVTVTDESGAVIPQASIALRNMETDAKRGRISSAAGVAVIPGLPAGNYELTVEASRFAAYKSPLTLTVGQIASFTAVLAVQGVTQQVAVHETEQGVDTGKSDVSQVIDTQNISDLPIAGRDFIDFVLLTPTANVGRSTAVGSQSPFTETVLQLSFGGLRETHSTFFGLDGVDYTTSISGVQRVSPSQDWVQEFRVVASPFTADYGRNLGSVVNTITKSGNNEVHGSAYEYFRNNDLDATNLLAAPDFNTLQFNQFGADAGGPIRQDKNFYFLGYEGQRRAESPLYSSFILHCIDTPNCLGPGTPSINQVKQTLGLQPENLGSILTIDNYDKLIAKSTNVLSDKTTLNAAFLFNDDRKQNVPGAAPGEGLPSSYRDNPVADQTAYGNLFHIFAPDFTSETVVSFARRTFNLNLTGAGYEPSIMVPDLLDSGGFQGSVHYYREQHFETAENLTYIHGNHTFKFGGDYEPVWISAETTFMSPGFGVFTPQSFFGVAPFCGPPCGPFGPGTAVEFLFLEPRQYFGAQVPQRTLPFQSGIYSGPAAEAFANSTDLNFRHQLSALYGQDTWKARPDLTITIGLRYDVDFLPSAQAVRVIGKLSPTNYGNVQPRAGLAYSFRGGKGVVRAGFGLFTGPFDYSDIMVTWQGASPFTAMNQPLIPEFSNPANDLVGFGASGIVGTSGPFLAGQAFNTFAHTGAYPAPGELQQFPLGFSKLKFPNAYAEQASLEIENEIAKDTFLSLGYQYIHALDLPIYYSINGLPNGTLPDGVQLFTPADTNFGFALYATPSAYSEYNAGTVSLRKNFAQYYSVLANYTFSKSIDIGTDVQLQDTPMDYLDPKLDRAVSDNDVRQRLVLTALGETPSRWPLLFRNFKASVLTTLESPLYYTILAGFDVNGDQFPFNDRVGNIGRNTYRGDPSYTTDVRLQRLLHFTERFQGQASVEVFNLFNRVNVNAIDTVYGAADFAGPIPRAYGDGVTSPDNPTFGSPTYVAPARQIQFSLRVIF
ncbi:MAG: TonB-dependent receptor [Candidatus Acidiferrales bacterium]